MWVPYLSLRFLTEYARIIRYTSLFSTNYTIAFFSDPKCFGRKRHPISGSRKISRHIHRAINVVKYNGKICIHISVIQ